MQSDLSAVDWVKLHARLLASGELRRLLRSDPAALARRLRFSGSVPAALARLDGEGIERQARGLLDKRWHEVCKWIPRTAEKLGPGGRGEFNRYAGGFWPEGHRRHLLDAQAFLEQLRRRGDSRLDARELGRVRFAAGSARWSVRLHRSIGGGPGRGWRGANEGPGLQVCWRNEDGRVRDWTWHVAMP